MPYPPAFAELYVVSDIHMSGANDGVNNFQIFNRGDRLGAFIRQIATIRPTEDVALVLNGDIIDSLAEDDVPGYVALDAGIALRMMERIYRDKAFAPVWDALGSFVAKPKRHLVLVIGNHDIELTLPVVEESIRRRLAEGNGDAQSRITFATRGAGYACRIGGAQVFCTHGNEVDPWNIVDYNILAQLGNAMNAGRVPDVSKWKPNAGTRLVIDVMNTVKRRFPFVDLLKPEVAAVASVMLALDRDLFRNIDLEDAFPVLRDKIKGGLVTKNLLGPSATTLGGAAPEAVARELTVQLLGPSFREAVTVQRQGSEDDLLLEAARPPTSERVPADAASGGEVKTLGAWDLVAGWVGLVPKVEGLRRALADWLREDTTFDVSNTKDDLFQAMTDRVADTVDFVVTGHTHLARALKFRRGSYYYNCGTWIRTLRLTGQALEPSAFESRVWPVLTAGSMSVLDGAKVPGPGGNEEPLLFDRTNAVRISVHGDRVVGDLLRVSDTGGDVALALEPTTSSFTVGS